MAAVIFMQKRVLLPDSAVCAPRPRCWNLAPHTRHFRDSVGFLFLGFFFFFFLLTKCRILRDDSLILFGVFVLCVAWPFPCESQCCFFFFFKEKKKKVIYKEASIYL